MTALIAQVGNLIFWLSFCVVGQPMCALLYYHDWVLAHSPQLLQAAPHSCSPVERALCEAL